MIDTVVFGCRGQLKRCATPGKAGLRKGTAKTINVKVSIDMLADVPHAALELLDALKAQSSPDLNLHIETDRLNEKSI